MAANDTTNETPRNDAQAQPSPDAGELTQKQKREIDLQAEEMLRDIEMGSTYSISKDIAEELDPADIHSAELGDSAEAGPAPVEEHVDELGEELNLPVEQPEELIVADEPTPEDFAEQAERRRGHLRRVLALVIIILLIVGAGIGVLIWHNTSAPNVPQSDPDALSTGAAGTQSAVFNAIPSDQALNLVSLFGKTPKDAVKASKDRLTLSGSPEKASDKNVKSLTSLQNAVLVDKTGQVTASIAFGLDKGGKIVYCYSSFDLDALGVAEAQFNELVSDDTIASSLLEAVGVSHEAATTAKLTLEADPDAITSNDQAEKEQAEFKGSTKLSKAPKTWAVTETYDHSIGTSLGDNSVMRTLLVELY